MSANLDKIETVLVHPGKPHFDEFAAVTLVLAYLLLKNGKKPPVLRKNPTPGQLEDPKVAVIDIGGRHEPHLNNYDHHQWPGDVKAPCCALTLVLKELGIYEDAQKVWPWLRVAELLDCVGPIQTEKALGKAANTFGADTRTPDFAIQFFGDSTFHAPNEFTHNLLQAAGLSLLRNLDRFQDRQKLFDADNKVVDVDGIKVVIATAVPWNDQPVFGLESWLQKNHPDTAVTVTRDDRPDEGKEPGYSLFRRGDHPRVYLHRLSGVPGVGFIHKNGLLAKVAVDADYMKLVADAVLPLPAEPVFEEKPIAGVAVMETSD